VDVDYRAFGRRLKEARARAGLSQEALGRSCRLHRTEISLLERGARDPRLSTIVRLANCLGVPPAALLDDEGSWRPFDALADELES
jgi:transcriptional regulator with XRE-family HTH domain